MKISTRMFRDWARAEGVPGWRKDGLFVARFMLAYSLARYVGALLFIEPEHIVMFWPASGVFLAGLLLSRKQLWPVLLVAAILVQLPHDILIYGETVANSVAVSLANCSEALVGAWLIRRTAGERFDRSSFVQLVSILTLGAGVGAAISATIGASAMVAAGDLSFWMTWKTWWLANALGMLVTTPLILFWLRPAGEGAREAYAGRLPEIAILFVCIVATAQYVYGAEGDPIRRAQDLPYIGLPFLLWLLLRFDTRLVASAMLILAGILIYNIDLGRGPFATLGYLGPEQLFSPQIFLAVRALILLLISSVVDERKRAINLLERSEGALRQRVSELEDAQAAILRTEAEITAEKERSEEYLEFLVTLLDNIQDEIVTCDADGVLTNTDDPRKAISHQPVAVPPEKWAAEFGLCQADGETLMQPEEVPLYRAWKGEMLRNVEMVIKKEGVPARRLIVNGGPMKAVNGNLLGAVVSMHDVTEMKKMEGQLRQAQKMEAVGQLTSGIAHDFNNVLAVVMGNLELAMERAAEGRDVEKTLSLAMDGAQRGADINRQLLTFSRHQVVEEKACDIDRVLSGMTDLLKRSIGEMVEIEATYGAADCCAMLDPAQLESAILNLAINARDAMPAGGKLTIETGIIDPDQYPGVEQPEQQHIHILISDNGAGIEPDVLERVLEPFYTTKQTGAGSGLGLPMVYAFVQRAGGRLEVDSTPGEGTDVHIFLPRCEGTQLPKIVGQAPPIAEAESNGELVLLVEDQADVRELVSVYLLDLGYRVLTAVNGQDALEIIAATEAKIDIVVSDMVMPGGMDGVQLITAAKKKIPGVKALLISGNPALSTPDDSGDAASLRLLRKPFRKPDLACELRACLSGE